MPPHPAEKAPQGLRQTGQRCDPLRISAVLEIRTGVSPRAGRISARSARYTPSKSSRQCPLPLSETNPFFSV